MSDYHTSSHRRRMYVTVLAVAALVCAALTMTNAANATGSSQTAKPTIVLVHGGWADSSGWKAQITALHERGYPVIAPANPLRGLTSDAEYLRSVLQTIDGPIVLVGHSYGGAVITNAARGVDGVEALVYIAAFAPDNGETLQHLVTMNAGTHITPDALTHRPYPLAEGGEGIDLYIKPEVFREAFAGDLPRKITDLMQATQRPFSVAAFTEPSAEPAWRTIPSWSLVATDDHAIPPSTQRFMAARAGSNTASVKASHVPMMSQPDATTRLIVQAADSVD